MTRAWTSSASSTLNGTGATVDRHPTPDTRHRGDAATGHAIGGAALSGVMSTVVGPLVSSRQRRCITTVVALRRRTPDVAESRRDAGGGRRRRA